MHLRPLEYEPPVQSPPDARPIFRFLASVLGVLASCSTGDGKRVTTVTTNFCSQRHTVHAVLAVIVLVLGALIAAVEGYASRPW